jgi:carboxyl-terminal processing protease
MKKISVKYYLLVIICLGSFILLGLHNDNSSVSAKDKNFYKDIKTFSEVLDMVRKNYVDEVDTTKLMA